MPKLDEMLGWGDHREFDLQNEIKLWERHRPVHSAPFVGESNPE